MSVFGTILEKLGMHRSTPGGTGTGSTHAQHGGSGSMHGSAQQQQNPQQRQAQASQQAQPQRQAQASQSTQAQSQPQGSQQRGTGSTGGQNPSAQMPLSETDVGAKLDRLAADNPQKLNWRTSIVDLMKLLGMESSLDERKQLAEELGYPREGMNDSAKMNVWLHKAVLWEIAKNGGNVPKELLN
jgi:hypothetical protein